MILIPSVNTQKSPSQIHNMTFSLIKNHVKSLNPSGKGKTKSNLKNPRSRSSKVQLKAYKMPRSQVKSLTSKRIKGMNKENLKNSQTGDQKTRNTIVNSNGQRPNFRTVFGI